MAKCSKCGKSGFFLKINKEGVCSACSSQADAEKTCIQTSIILNEPTKHPEFVMVLTDWQHLR